MADDIILNKCAIIENCLKRIHEEYHGYENLLSTNYTKQDSIILNLQRACEASIDLGMRWIRMQKLGIPQTSRDVFTLLQKNLFLPQQLSEDLQAMVGFRNIAVHEYQKINLSILEAILNKKLDNFRELIRLARMQPGVFN